MSGQLKTASGPWAWIERQLESLSDRDRKLLLGMYAFFGLASVIGLWWILHGVLDDKAGRVRDLKTKMLAVHASIGDYDQAKAQVDAQESRLKAYQSQNFSAFVEGVASKHQISDMLRSVNASGTPEVVGRIQQTTYEIEIKKSEYQPFFEFLHELETSGYPVTVRNATLKTSFQRRVKMLDVRLEVVVSSLAGA